MARSRSLLIVNGQRRGHLARTNNINFLVHNINIQVIGRIFSHICKLNTEGMHSLCGALVYMGVEYSPLLIPSDSWAFMGDKFDLLMQRSI